MKKLATFFITIGCFVNVSFADEINNKGLICLDNQNELNAKTSVKAFWFKVKKHLIFRTSINTLEVYVDDAFDILKPNGIRTEIVKSDNLESLTYRTYDNYVIVGRKRNLKNGVCSAEVLNEKDGYCFELGPYAKIERSSASMVMYSEKNRSCEDESDKTFNCIKTENRIAREGPIPKEAELEKVHYKCSVFTNKNRFLNSLNQISEDRFEKSTDGKKF